MRFALNQNGLRVCIDDVEPGDMCFCPECGEKMVQKRGEIVIHHFAHYPNTQCTDTWYYDESDWHTAWQTLFPKDSQEVSMELDKKKHRADVLLSNKNLVIEFQQDHITPSEFKSRNEFFTKLGHKVLWVFDESIPFESDAISSFGDLDKANYYHWSRASRTFSGFTLEENKGVELWFQLKDDEEKDALILTNVIEIENPGSLSSFKGSNCYSRQDFLTYISTGKKLPDRGSLYDDHFVLMRNDGKRYVYSCPCCKEPFQSYSECDGCEHCEAIIEGKPDVVSCHARCKQFNLRDLSEITSDDKNDDGFICKVHGITADGEVLDVDIDTPKTALRTLPELWEAYKPLRVMECVNVKTHIVFTVFNPAWQKATNGSIKGRVCNWKGKAYGEPREIYSAEKRIWLMVWFARPGQP